MGKRDRSNRKFQRKEGTREERKTTNSRDLLTFSFQYLDETQPEKSPESAASWEKIGLLKSAIGRIKDLSKLTRNEAEKQNQIKIYGDFPETAVTDFFHPKHVEDNVTGGVIKAIGGQTSTIAGFIVESTFYVVFFDKDHRFWITQKKHT